MAVGLPGIYIYIVQWSDLEVNSNFNYEVDGIWSFSSSGFSFGFGNGFHEDL